MNCYLLIRYQKGHNDSKSKKENRKISWEKYKQNGERENDKRVHKY